MLVAFLLLFFLQGVVYMVTSVFYHAQARYKRMDNYKLQDFNLNFPPGLALLLREWIEEYMEMASAKREAAKKGEDKKL
jgi:predicted membrane channel-forming protein YqfA (hemolysin III family)